MMPGPTVDCSDVQVREGVCRGVTPAPCMCIFYFHSCYPSRTPEPPPQLSVTETAGSAKIAAYYFSKKGFNFFIFSMDSKEIWVFTEVSLVEMPHGRVSKPVSDGFCGTGCERIHKSLESLWEQEQNPREASRRLLDCLPLCCDES
jgi:hypothetical protein